MYILLILCFFHVGFALDLTLEEKVGRLLMVQVHGEKVNEDARVLIQELGVGGIIYYDWCNKLHTLEKIQAFSKGLQALAKYPLLIAADMEGGRVFRFREAFSEIPGNDAIGKMGNSKLAHDVAYALGAEMKKAGINMNFAPVVDVNSNPLNPVIGKRSYSRDPIQVAAFGKEALRGYREACIIATLKHYPGHRDTETDSHEALAVVKKSREELNLIELYPFVHLKEAEAIMTAHIMVPAFDPDTCATLSKKTLDYLRNEIGFQGVIVTDSLVMQGVLKKCETPDEAVIQALNAGCDLLLLGGKLLSGEKAGLELKIADMKRIHGVILDAVKTGRIAESRVDEAVNRILDLKQRYIWL